jgi:hypothetical protein
MIGTEMQMQATAALPRAKDRVRRGAVYIGVSWPGGAVKP